MTTAQQLQILNSAVRPWFGFSLDNSWHINLAQNVLHGVALYHSSLTHSKINSGFNYLNAEKFCTSLLGCITVIGSA